MALRSWVYALLSTSPRSAHDALIRPRLALEGLETRIVPTVPGTPNGPIDLSPAEVAENLPAGAEVGILRFRGSPFGVYQFSQGDGNNDNALFTIDTATDKLRTATPFDFEARSTYFIDVRGVDPGSGETSEETFVVSISNVNEIPTNIRLSNRNVAENLPAGTTVGTFSGTDPENAGPVTWFLDAGPGGDDNGSFTVDPNGDLKTAAAFDFETKPSYSIRLRATDATGVSAYGSITINVIDGPEAPANAAPTDVSLSKTDVAENRPAGTVIGTLGTTDPDAGNTFTYALVGGAGDADNGSFTVDANGDLKAAAAFDFETKSSYTVRVRSTDQGGLFTEKPFTITVDDVHEAPTDIALSNASLDENRPAGTVVGTLSTTDVDIGSTFTYALVAGAGDADNAAFTVDANGNLKAAAPFDFEAKSTYTVRVLSTDDGNLTIEKAFTITVGDVPEAPANSAPTDVSLPAPAVAENRPPGTVVGTFGTTDPDAGDTFTYALVAGPGDADNGSFTVDAAGNLLTAAAFDFEAKAAYSVRVRSTDAGGLSTEKAFTIAVGDVNEVPPGGGDPGGGDPGGDPLGGPAVPGDTTIPPPADPFTGFRGEVRTAAADLTGDGVADRIYAAGQNNHVKVFDGATGAEVWSFFAFPGFSGGASVAAGDVNGDGRADLVVGAGAGAPGARVRVFSGSDGAELHSFFAFPGFSGGVSVAAGDVNGDGRADVVAGAGVGAVGGHVKVFSGVDATELRSFFAFPGYLGGVTVAAGDIDGDGHADVVVGAASTAPHVKVFGGRDNTEMLSFFAFPEYPGGVRVAARDVDGDGLGEIVAAAAAAAGRVHMKVFDGDLNLLASDFDTDLAFNGGTFVG